MDISGTSQSSADPDTRSATASRKRNVAVSSVAGGLSAWLGGVAFCVGVGVAAPMWVALPLTVLSVTAAGLNRTLLRRNARIADGPAG
jgi:hypothetical protein